MNVNPNVHISKSEKETKADRMSHSESSIKMTMNVFSSSPVNTVGVNNNATKRQRHHHHHHRHRCRPSHNDHNSHVHYYNSNGNEQYCQHRHRRQQNIQTNKQVMNKLKPVSLTASQNNNNNTIPFTTILIIISIFFVTFASCASLSPSSSSSSSSSSSLSSSSSSSSSSFSSYSSQPSPLSLTSTLPKLPSPASTFSEIASLSSLSSSSSLSASSPLAPNETPIAASSLQDNQKKQQLEHEQRRNAMQQHIKRQASSSSSSSSSSSTGANNRQALERPYMRSIFLPSPYVTTPGPIFINFTRLLINRLNTNSPSLNSADNRIERKFIFIDKRPGSVKNTVSEMATTAGQKNHNHQIPDPSRKKTLVKVKMVTNGSKQTMLYDKSTTIAPDIVFTTSTESPTEREETEVTTNVNMFFKSLTLEPIVDLENNLQKRSEFELPKSTNRIKPSRTNSKVSNFDPKTTTPSITETTTTTTTTTTPAPTTTTTETVTPTTTTTVKTPAATTTIKTNDFSSIVTIVTEPPTEAPAPTTPEPTTESRIEVMETTVNMFNIDFENVSPSSSTPTPVKSTERENDDEHRCYFDQESLCPGHGQEPIMCFGSGEIDCSPAASGENCRLLPGNSREHSVSRTTAPDTMYFYCNYPLKTRNCRGVARCEIAQPDEQQTSDPSSSGTSTPSNESDAGEVEGAVDEVTTRRSLAPDSGYPSAMENSEPTKNPLKQNFQTPSTVSTLKVALISGLVAVGVLVIIAVSIVAFVSWQKLKVGPAGSSTVTLNDSYSESEYYSDKPTVIHVNSNWNANRRIS